MDFTRLTVYAAKFARAGLSDNMALVISATLSAIVGAYIGNKLLKKITLKFVDKLHDHKICQPPGIVNKINVPGMIPKSQMNELFDEFGKHFSKSEPRRPECRMTHKIREGITGDGKSFRHNRDRDRPGVNFS
ncbi:MAG: hypothetical protein K8R21_11320 [Leptospira sp.]|nr:hypothetical protein [Leptospira sp.]